MGLTPASSGQSMNYSFSHFRVVFTRESRLVLIRFILVNIYLKNTHYKC